MLVTFSFFFFSHFTFSVAAKELMASLFNLSTRVSFPSPNAQYTSTLNGEKPFFDPHNFLYPLFDNSILSYRRPRCSSCLDGTRTL